MTLWCVTASEPSRPQRFSYNFLNQFSYNYEPQATTLFFLFLPNAARCFLCFFVLQPSMKSVGIRYPTPHPHPRWTHSWCGGPGHDDRRAGSRRWCGWCDGGYWRLSGRPHRKYNIRINNISSSNSDQWSGKLSYKFFWLFLAITFILLIFAADMCLKQ